MTESLICVQTCLRRRPCFLYNTHHTPKDCHEAPSWLRGGRPARFTRYGSTIRFFWFSDSRPSDTPGFDRATVWMRPEGLSHPVWVEMITGRVFEIPEKDIRREKDRLLITVPASRWSR